MVREALRWKVRQAGGIDVQEDVGALLSSFDPNSLSESDVAYGAYLFEYIGGITGDNRARDFSNDLATVYAKMFAGWLGYVFLNRSNMARASQDMKMLQDSMADWVEYIPEMLRGPDRPLSSFIPKQALRFLRADVLDKLGDRAVREVKKDYSGSGSKSSAGLEALPINYDPKARAYVIPGSQATYTNRRLLSQLGFKWDGNTWATATLDQRVLEALPQAATLKKVPSKPSAPTKDPTEWFFEDWLPSNIQRFSKLFTTYGRQEHVPYEFKFILNGREVTVLFQRNIKTVADAVAELESRYGGADDRDGWMQAVWSYQELSRASGRSAIKAVDRANDLEHSHGSMMEHFPPGIRSWYPAFLDFKYTAGTWQMVHKIRDEDLRTIATEMMPLHDREERLAPKPTDYRTPKGLATEVASQPGKSNKKKFLKGLKTTNPDIYPEIVKLLRERGLDLE